MKKSMFLVLGSVMALSLSQAYANDEKAGPGKGSRLSENFKISDSNSDGFVSHDEFRARGDQMFKDIDTNSDGKLSPDEMREHHKQQFQKWKSHRAEMAGKSGDKPAAPIHDGAKPAEKK